MAKEESVEVVKATTVQVIETLCDKIGPIIKQVAESLGTSSEQIMVIFTKQVYANAIENFLTAFICVGVAFAWMRFSTMWADKIKNHGWDNDGIIANVVLSAFMYPIMTIVVSMNFIYGIKRLINPEYYSFNEVLSKVTKLIGE